MPGGWPVAWQISTMPKTARSNLDASFVKNAVISKWLQIPKISLIWKRKDLSLKSRLQRGIVYSRYAPKSGECSAKAVLLPPGFISTKKGTQTAGYISTNTNLKPPCTTTFFCLFDVTCESAAVAPMSICLSFFHLSLLHESQLTNAPISQR